MNMRWAVIAAAGLLTAADGAKEDAKVKEELQKLQGTWTFVSLEVDGNKTPEAALKGSTVVVKGDTFTTVTGDVTYKGTFKLDVAKKPKTIDLMFTEGPEKGNTSLAIYELDGDAWRICLDIGN